MLLLLPLPEAEPVMEGRRVRREWRVAGGALSHNDEAITRLDGREGGGGGKGRKGNQHH